MHKFYKYVLHSSLCGLLLFSFGAFAQVGPRQEPDPPKNWHQMDLKTDGFYGISLNQAYKFLQGKKSKTVVVTTIDSGIDTAQADLKSILWVNPNEIPGNGIDDDHDGLVDDVHGWNFLGGKDGKSDYSETIEEVRQYYQLKDKYTNVTVAPAGKEKEFAYWKEIKFSYDSAVSKAKIELKEITEEVNVLSPANYYIKKELKLQSNQTFNKHDLDKLSTTTNDTLKYCKTIWASVFDQVGENVDNAKVLKNLSEFLEKDNNTISPELEMRSRIVGDNPDVLDGKPYGNNLIKGIGSDHGTGVAGLIGAVRNNGYGIDGVADNVRIMSLRAVPDGDEYDKDVATALRYAVDHGAKVVNMSFGKNVSPHKDWVQDAFKYAAAKDVLLVIASGNDGQDMDVSPDYPNDHYSDGTSTDNVINVGASGPRLNENLAADFSNYGKQNVDIFAPGVKVTSVDMDAETDTEDGTSFAAPIVSGIAALILEYYPALSAKQVKQAILQSATPLTGTMVKKPGSKTEKVDFSTLSKSGGIVNAYKALEIASKMTGEREIL